MLFGLLALLAPAWAQSTEDATFDFEIFRPHADYYGFTVVPGAATLGNLQLGVGAWLNYADDPMVLVNANGDRVSVTGEVGAKDNGDGLVEQRVGADLQVGMGFTRYASLTLDLPVALSQKAWDVQSLDDPTGDPLTGAAGGLRDLTLTAKGAILDPDKMPVGLAVSVPVGVPTGGSTGYLGEKGVTVDPNLILEWANGSIRQREYKFRAAANVGYFLRTSDARLRDIHLGNSVNYGLGLGFHPINALELMLEFHGSSYGSRMSQNPAEVLLGAKILAGPMVQVNVGGGVGVMGGVGAPDFRLYTGVSVAPNFDPASRDTDGDDIADGEDRCPKDPEDLDSFQDTDGCPELDNDADGREDGVDKCPNDPEDDDGYLDNDGCPDPDNDKDKVNDDMDRCPDQAETINGFDDEDGCPDEKPVDDTDGDGYKDDLDRCPYDAEDLDNFEDEDGCPDKDNDGDSILDAADKCPNEREVFNGVEDTDGCPDESQRVVLEQGQIKINDVIYFDPGKATIQERSFDLVSEIASVLTAHPELKKVRVEGHTDSDGNDAANLKLSQARANAVVAFLVSKGVDASRLDPVGFGESRPLEPNTTPEGKAKNRRVEFIIVDRD